jgi:hypothetical protein
MMVVVAAWRVNTRAGLVSGVPENVVCGAISITSLGHSPPNYA